MNLYEAIKALIREKTSIFIRGAFIGGISGALFLFSNADINAKFFVAFSIRLLATAISAFISGFATILAGDVYQAMKGRKKKKQK